MFIFSNHRISRSKYIIKIWVGKLIFWVEPSFTHGIPRDALNPKIPGNEGLVRSPPSHHNKIMINVIMVVLSIRILVGDLGGLSHLVSAA